jgi:hypothetical protein
VSSTLRPKAGDVIASVLPRNERGEIVWYEAARTVVDGEWPHLLETRDGLTRRNKIHQWRTYFKRWVKKPVAYIDEDNATILARYWPVDPKALSRPELTEMERRLRKAERLERQARELRGEI